MTKELRTFLTFQKGAATAALDAESQDSMMELFRKELERATLISVGHRTELEEYHERKLTLHRHAARVEMAAGEDIQHGPPFVAAEGRASVVI